MHEVLSYMDGLRVFKLYGKLVGESFTDGFEESIDMFYQLVLYAEKNHPKLLSIYYG